MSLKSEQLNMRGAELRLEGDNSGAKLHYLVAIHEDPNNWKAISNLFMVLADDDSKLETALAWGKKLISMIPHYAPGYYNVGNVLTRLWRMKEAEEYLSKARELAPDDPNTWYNSAINAYRDRKPQKALDWIDEAIKLNPTSENMIADRAYFLLDLARLDEALVAYEARWNHLIHLDPWDLYVPEWKGEDLAGKHILVHSEQGFGDAIMLSRFLPILAEKAGKVTFGSPPTMCRLFEAQGWNIEVVDLDKVDEIGPFDFHSPMFSVWRHLGVQIKDIDSKPYLKAPEHDLPKLRRRSIGILDGDKRVATQHELHVGIAWASGRYGGEHGVLRRRIPLELFLPLASLPGVRAHSLQMGGDEVDLERLDTQGLIEDPIHILKDWATTAWYVSQLDLVVCCETALAHLAGALGKPVIMLAPYRSCWRWWSLDIDGTGWPWYSGFRIIRQDTPFSWESAMHEVLVDVKERANGRRVEAA